ncbi:MAG: hypothetical protein M5R42_13250 [Rhodocyclaceae bacterium]|nr:hypothetical protein [Rhodocyclaceae bacterium]
MVALLEQAANLEGLALFIWSVADGLRRSSNTQPITQTYEFLDALRHIDKTQQNGVYVMLDAHPYLAEPVNARLVREIANEYNKTARTLVFVSPRIELNAELARMSALYTVGAGPGGDTGTPARGNAAVGATGKRGAGARREGGAAPAGAPPERHGA